MADETRNPRYVGLLALVSGTILFVGLLLKPSEIESESTATAVPVLSQAEISRVRRMAQRGSLDSMTEYFASVAETLAPHVVYFANDRSSGVVWEFTSSWTSTAAQTSSSGSSPPRRAELGGRPR